MTRWGSRKSPRSNLQSIRRALLERVMSLEYSRPKLMLAYWIRLLGALFLSKSWPDHAQDTIPMKWGKENVQKADLTTKRLLKQSPFIRHGKKGSSGSQRLLVEI